MPEMFPVSVDIFYEESKAARAGLDDLLQTYRSNTTTVLTLATGAATFFSLSDSSKGPWYVAALAFFAVAALLAVSIFWPIRWRVNVTNGMSEALLADAEQTLTGTKTKFDLGVGHQAAITANGSHILGPLGIARRFSGLIIATGLVVVCAGVNVAVASDPPSSVTRVQIVEGD